MKKTIPAAKHALTLRFLRINKMGVAQMKSLFFTFVFTAMSALAACGDFKAANVPSSSNQNESVITDLVKLPKQMTKKGTYTDVQFSHNYDGQTALFETETFNLGATSGYGRGMLHISLVTKDGLELVGESEFAFQVPGESIELPVSVIASTADTHYVRVLATLDMDGFDPVIETWGVAIHVEDNSALASFSAKASQSVRLDENEEPVIVLKADEVIY